MRAQASKAHKRANHTRLKADEDRTKFATWEASVKQELYELRSQYKLVCARYFINKQSQFIANDSTVLVVFFFIFLCCFDGYSPPSPLLPDSPAP